MYSVVGTLINLQCEWQWSPSALYHYVKTETSFIQKFASMMILFETPECGYQYQYDTMIHIDNKLIVVSKLTINKSNLY